MINQMTEKEYRAYPAINFSSLASYYNDGIYSPDHALMHFDFKSYFEYGKMFESLLQDVSTGSKTFKERYFMSQASGKMPDAMIGWLDNGEDLTKKYKMCKPDKETGEIKRNNQSKTLHGFLDEAIANPGKVPVSIEQKEMLDIHVRNMLAMMYEDTPVKDLLAAAEWQVPLIWVDLIDGLEKKALIDCMVRLKGKVLLFDIKTTANFKQFGYMLDMKYWLQDIQYTNAVNERIGHCDNMVFLVASKEKPLLCQPWYVDYGGINYRATAIEEYSDTCRSYAKWIKDGRKPKGWLPLTGRRFHSRTII